MQRRRLRPGSRRAAPGWRGGIAEDCYQHAQTCGHRFPSRDEYRARRRARGDGKVFKEGAANQRPRAAGASAIPIDRGGSRPGQIAGRRSHPRAAGILQGDDYAFNRSGEFSRSLVGRLPSAEHRRLDWHSTSPFRPRSASSSRPSSRRWCRRTRRDSIFRHRDRRRSHCRRSGAVVVRQRDAGCGQHHLCTLNAAGWKGLGNPAGSKGYKYKGKSDPRQRLQQVVLIKSTVIKAVCKGDGGHPDAAVAGDARASTSRSPPAPRRRTATAPSYGGTEAKNDATGLKRQDAPAPKGAPCAAAAPIRLQSRPDVNFSPTTR